MPFENYLAGKLPEGSRLSPGFKTFDFFDVETGVATSAKTLDTMTAAKIANPADVYSSLRSNINAAASFDGVVSFSGKTLDIATITARELIVAIPAGTNPAQWEQISKAVTYGLSKGVTLKITVVKP